MGEKGEFRHGERGMVVVFRWAALSILETAGLLFQHNNFGGFRENGQKKRKYPVSCRS